MLKKYLTLFLATLLVCVPMHATAVDLDNVLTSITGSGTAVSVNNAGSFSSQARTGVSAGGIEVRVPRMSGNTPQLLSITPPRITAGCNGISAHFGGFSFISGEEFANLLKQIASGAALGFVSSLVMKTLCPACEAVVQELKTAAANAAAMARNSCEWGKQTGIAFQNKFFGGNMDSVQMCANEAPVRNDASDSAFAWGNLCNNIRQAKQKLYDYNTGGASTPEEKERLGAAAKCEIGSGNVTWQRLASFDLQGTTEAEKDASYARRVLLLNLMGADLAPLPASDSSPLRCQQTDGQFMTHTGKTDDTVYCKPPVDVKALSGLFLCGAPGSNGAWVTSAETSARVNDYCKKFFGDDERKVNLNTQVWSCGNDRVNCTEMTLVPASQELVKGEGFLITVNRLLRNAVERVRNGTGFDDAEGAKLIKLVAVAPYPLYQAINAAAVYPAAAADLLDSMSILVAEQFTYSLLDEFLRVKNRGTSTMCSVSSAQADQMMQFITSFRSENNARKELIGQNFVLQQAISRQIQEINLAIQQQTMSQDLVSTGRFAQSLNRAVTPQQRVAPATP